MIVFKNIPVHIPGASGFSVCIYSPFDKSFIEYTAQFGHEESDSNVSSEYFARSVPVGLRHGALKNFGSLMCDEKEGGVLQVVPNALPRAIEGAL